MFCNQCGTTLRDDASFCTVCGKTVQRREEAKPQRAAEPIRPRAAAENIVKSQGGLWWSEGAPLLFHGWEIVRLPSGGVALTLSIENLAEPKVTAVYLSLRGYNVLKEERCEIGEVALLDLSVAAGDTATPPPYALPDETIRQVAITLQNVVYEDDTIWKNSEAEPLEEVAPATEEIPETCREGVKSLVRDLYPKGADKITYQSYPLEGAGYWVCGCGSFNVGAACVSCGIERSLVFRMLTEENIGRAQATYDAEQEERKRLERERALRREAERKAQEEREREEMARLREQERQRLEREAEAERRRQEQVAAERVARAQARQEQLEALKRSAAGFAEMVGSKTVQAGNAIAAASGELARQTGERMAENRAAREAQRAANAAAYAAAAQQSAAYAAVPIQPAARQSAPIQPAAQQPTAYAAAPTQAAPMFCGNCGSRLVPGDMFCGECGARVEE